MSVLVLGGAGYIGSHAVYQFIERDEKVVVVDNLQAGHEQAIHPKAKYYKGELRDKEFISSVFEQVNILFVINFALNSLVCESIEKLLLYYDNNVYGTQVLLETMAKYDVKHIVFS